MVSNYPKNWWLIQNIPYTDRAVKTIVSGKHVIQLRKRTKKSTGGKSCQAQIPQRHYTFEVKCLPFLHNPLSNEYKQKINAGRKYTQGPVPSHPKSPFWGVPSFELKWCDCLRNRVWPGLQLFISFYQIHVDYRNESQPSLFCESYIMPVISHSHFCPWL